MICAIYEDGFIAETTIHKWFTRFFKSGNVFLKDKEHSAKLEFIDDDQIEMSIKNNPGHTIKGIAEIHHIFYVSITRHLKAFGYMNHYDG